MTEVLHPRLLQYRRYWERREYARGQLGPGVRESRATRYVLEPWKDYYPEVVGTIPEKIVFGELIERGITFIFTPFWGDFPFTTDITERARPDFILPEYRIIIEVYGTYWHTRQGSAARDAMRAAMYEASGYKYYFLWDVDILTSPADSLNSIPELFNPAIKTGQVYMSKRPTDPRASMAARSQGRLPRVVRTRVKGVTRIPGIRRIQKVYLKPPTKETSRSVGYGGFAGLPEDYLGEIRDYSQSWLEYISTLEGYFKEFPWAWEFYPDLYRYWERWSEYWDRWQRILEPGFLGQIEAMESRFRNMAFKDVQSEDREAFRLWLTYRGFVRREGL